MKTDGGFFKQEEVMSRATSATFGLGLVGGDLGGGQFGDQLQPLGFAAGKSRAGLAQLQITKAGLGQKPARRSQARLGRKEFGRLLGRKVEGVVD